MGNGTWWASTSGFPVSLGPVQRTRACRAAGLRLLNLVNHPGHPTAVGGLPASEPGLDAGALDLAASYGTGSGEGTPVRATARSPRATGTVNGAMGLGIPTSSQNKDAAWDYIKFLASPDIEAKYAASSPPISGQPSDGKRWRSALGRLRDVARIRIRPPSRPIGWLAGRAVEACPGRWPVVCYPSKV